MLGNLETASDKLIQIVLVGQPELRTIIGSPELRQLNQRITIKFHLGTLSAEDAGGYIDHRLRVAGANGGPIFDDDAKARIFRASNGIPRLINVLCDHALLEAFVNGRRSVEETAVRNAIAEMDGYYMDASEEVGSAERDASPSRGDSE